MVPPKVPKQIDQVNTFVKNIQSSEESCGKSLKTQFQ